MFILYGAILLATICSSVTSAPPTFDSRAEFQGWLRGLEATASDGGRGVLDEEWRRVFPQTEHGGLEDVAFEEMRFDRTNLFFGQVNSEDAEEAVLQAICRSESEGGAEAMHHLS